MNLILKSCFSSAHRYFQPKWSPKQNQEVFGRCFSEYGHGHNYILEVGFKVEPENVSRHKEKMQAFIDDLTRALDHEHLNFAIPEFKTVIPTTENLALYFLEKLKASVPENQLTFIRLYEMDNLWTEILL